MSYLGSDELPRPVVINPKLVRIHLLKMNVRVCKVESTKPKSFISLQPWAEHPPLARRSLARTPIVRHLHKPCPFCRLVLRQP